MPGRGADQTRLDPHQHHPPPRSAPAGVRLLGGGIRGVGCRRGRCGVIADVVGVMWSAGSGYPRSLTVNVVVGDHRTGGVVRALVMRPGIWPIKRWRGALVRSTTDSPGSSTGVIFEDVVIDAPNSRRRIAGPVSCRASASCFCRAAGPGAGRPVRPQLNCSTARFHTKRASAQCRSSMNTDCAAVGYKRYRCATATPPSHGARQQVSGSPHIA